MGGHGIAMSGNFRKIAPFTGMFVKDYTSHISLHVANALCFIVFMCQFDQGIRMIFDEQCWHKSLAPLMESVREQMGDMPVYFTFDIDGVAAAVCPGTGMYVCLNIRSLYHKTGKHTSYISVGRVNAVRVA